MLMLSERDASSAPRPLLSLLCGPGRLLSAIRDLASKVSAERERTRRASRDSARVRCSGECDLCSSCSLSRLPFVCVAPYALIVAVAMRRHLKPQLRTHVTIALAFR